MDDLNADVPDGSADEDSGIDYDYGRDDPEDADSKNDDPGNLPAGYGSDEPFYGWT